MFPENVYESSFVTFLAVLHSSGPQAEGIILYRPNSTGGGGGVLWKKSFLFVYHLHCLIFLAQQNLILMFLFPLFF